MKSIISKLTVVLFIAITISSCGVDLFNRIDGNRNVVTENRKINNDFNAVKISSGIDLYITQGDKVSLTVEADENLQDLILTEVENGRLKIYTEKNIWRAKARKVHLTVVNLDELTATSGSDVYTRNTINTTNFKISTSSGADARVTVNAVSVSSSASSGSDLKITGETDSHISKASSGSSINAYGLASKNTTVRVSSGADINIHASETIDAKASSGGDIDYKGNPKKVNKKTSSGGSVSRR
jgi:hypothetical protein